MAIMAVLAAAPIPACGQDTDAGTTTHELHPAAGVEVWASTDSDNTDVLKVLGRALWNYEGRDKYQGVAFEEAMFRPLGQETRYDERVYIDLADQIGSKWLWKARIGTDGDTVLGSAEVRTADWKQSYFIEREIVETPRGVDEGIYYTLVGASLDLPADERNVFTVMAGVQPFTGDNTRLHLRGSYTHVLQEKWGLSARLWARYYHSTTPNEFDYFSPRDFVDILPVLQMRRFNNSGWMFLLAGGYGAQKATGSDWHPSRYADLRVESPVHSRKFNAFAQVQYSNTSNTGGLDYNYVMGSLGLTYGF
jgi:hypothetical protein